MTIEEEPTNLDAVKDNQRACVTYPLRPVAKPVERDRSRHAISTRPACHSGNYVESSAGALLPPPRGGNKLVRANGCAGSGNFT